MTIHQLSLPLSLDALDRHAAEACAAARDAVRALEADVLPHLDVLSGSDVRSVVTALRRGDLFSERRLNELEALVEELERRVDAGTVDLGQWREPTVAGGERTFEVLGRRLSPEVRRMAAAAGDLRSVRRSVGAVLDIMAAQAALTGLQRRQH